MEGQGLVDSLANGDWGYLPLLITHTVQDSAYCIFACWRGEDESSTRGITGTLILTRAATKWFHGVSF